MTLFLAAINNDSVYSPSNFVATSRSSSVQSPKFVSWSVSVVVLYSHFRFFDVLIVVFVLFLFLLILIVVISLFLF